MLDGDKFPVLTPQSNGRTAASASSSSEDLIDLNSEVERLQDALPRASTRNAALETAISAAELAMRALKLVDDPAAKKTYSARVDALLKEAERIKTSRDWQSGGRLLHRTMSGVTDAQKVKKLKEPSSTRETSKAEQILVMRASFLNGLKFPPWQGPPKPTDFEMEEGEGSFLDQPELRLSEAQLRVFDGWKRAEEALPPPNWFPGGRQNLGPSMSFTRKMDLVQDAATDCSVVASLCAGTARAARGHSKILSQVIHPYDDQNLRPRMSPNGKYIIRLNFNGSYRRVEIDDRLPVSKTSRVLHVIDRHNPGLLWPALVEKAYLKVRGGYDFPGSNSGTDLWILTGWIPEQVFLQNYDFHPNVIWKRISNAFTYGDVLVTMGTGKMSSREEREVGLAGEHDYAILDMKEMDDQKFMLVKNPWCEGTSWKGSIPRLKNKAPAADGSIQTEGLDDDDELVPSPRDLLNSDDQLTPGTFWMDLNSILQHFESIYLNWNPGLFSHRQDIHFPWDLTPGMPASVSRGRFGSFCEDPQFSISTSHGGTVWLLLCRHFQNAPGQAGVQQAQMGQSEIDLTGYISLYAFDSSGTKVFLSDGALMRGPFVDSPQTLLRLDNLIANKKYTAVALEQHLLPIKHTFTLSAWANSPINIDHAPEKYPHCSTVSSSWTKDSAGGNAQKPTYAQNPQFCITVPANSAISVLLQTPCEDINVNVRLVHGKGKRVQSVRSRDIVFDSKEYRRGCALAEFPDLDAGAYTIICSTFEEGQVGDFVLRVDTMVPCQLFQLAREGAGRLKTKLANVIFRPGDNRITAPIAPNRLVKLMATAQHKHSPSLVPSGGQRHERSMIRISIELGRGPNRRFLISSSGGEFSDSPSGVRTEDIDVSPAMIKKTDMWLVVERMFTPKDLQEEVVEVEMYSDVPDALVTGVWRRAEEPN